MDHVTCPRPLQGQFVLRMLGLAMMNLHTKFEVSVFTHYEDMKFSAMQNVEDRVFGRLGVNRGYQQCHRSMETIRLSCTILES